MLQKDKDALRNMVPAGCFLESSEELVGYSYDSQAVEAMPEAVCLPSTTAEVSRIMAYCYQNDICVTPRGAASGTTGGAVPMKGGLVLSLQRMNAIEAIDTKNFVATVQPGVFTSDLHAAVEKVGLFYPPDPGSMKYSTLGGNIAENAGGMRALKYGVTAAFVMGLEVVLPDGQIIHTGSKCIKDVVGLNIAPLFIGSEGMLGIITKAYLRLVPLQKQRKTCRIAFATLADTVKTVTNILQEGVVPLTLEFMDAVSIEAVGKGMDLQAPDGTGGLLIIEVEGSESIIEEDIRTIVEVCQRSEVLEIRIAETEEERDFFWKARRSIPSSLLRLKPRRFNEDIVVPRSNIFEMSERINAISRKYNLTIASFGHAGDGNIHANVLCEDTEEERARALQAVADLFKEATALEGRISGEHGIGIAKQPFIGLNIDESTMRFMRQFKKVFDPKGLLNPGKVFPDEH